MSRIILIVFALLTFNVQASGVLSEAQLKAIAKAEVEAEKLSIVAGLLADYEIQAKKLVNGLQSPKLAVINTQSTDLMNLAQAVISSAKFRLPQCDAYLTKTLALKSEINTISHEAIERDYHHDGLLPKAPYECYHTKDLFIHPATVLIHTRDHPSLPQATTEAINAEIAEVLVHLDQVRQMIVY